MAHPAVGQLVFYAAPFVACAISGVREILEIEGVVRKYDDAGQ